MAGAAVALGTAVELWATTAAGGVVVLNIFGMMKKASRPTHSATTPTTIKGINERRWGSKEERWTP
ncbi:hypothetical protein NHF46_02020 [Arthrobacter alpinus]|nr:hypothetical protein [Arthrobacter alpinus]